MSRGDPKLWQIPQWHADWDGAFQFTSLQTFAKALQDATDLDVTLSIIEEGYVRLEVFGTAARIGMVYVNRGDDPLIPLFTVYAGAEDDELTTTDAAAALEFLDRRQTSLKEDAG